MAAKMLICLRGKPEEQASPGAEGLGFWSPFSGFSCELFSGISVCTDLEILSYSQTKKF